MQVNVAIMRAFVSLREMLASNHELARRLEQMEKKYDARFKIVFDAIRATDEAASRHRFRLRLEALNSEPSNFSSSVICNS